MDELVKNVIESKPKISMADLEKMGKETDDVTAEIERSKEKSM